MKKLLFLNIVLLILLSCKENEKEITLKSTEFLELNEKFEIYNGSFLNLPEYSLKANYRPQFIGTYFTLLGGKKRYIQPFIDKDLYYIINNGFKA